MDERPKPFLDQQNETCSPTTKANNATPNGAEFCSSLPSYCPSSSAIAAESNLSVFNRRPQKLLIPALFRQKMKTNDPLKCKICLQHFNEPYTTICGHTFCRACIMNSLQFSSHCPLCDSGLDTKKARFCNGNGGGSSNSTPTAVSNSASSNSSSNNGGANTTAAALTTTVSNNIVLCPNYTVAELFEQQKTFGGEFLFGRQISATKRQPQQCMIDNAQTERSIINMLLSDRQLSLDSLRRIEEKLRQKRIEMELNDTRMSALLLHNFLELMIEKRDQMVKQVQAELELLKQDRQRVLTSLISDKQQIRSAAPSLQQLVPDLSASTASTSTADIPGQQQTTKHDGDDKGPKSVVPLSSSASLSCAIDAIGTQLAYTAVPECMVQLRHRMLRHVASLETAYLSQRMAVPCAVPPVQKEIETAVGSTISTVTDSLDEFSLLLKNMYRYGNVKVLTTLNYNIDAYNLPSIVSSIEFDKDGDFFVIAGVTKMIKLYDFNALIGHCSGDSDETTAVGENGITTTPAAAGAAFVHQPMVQLRCNSKISNVSWNPYNKHMLASSDYDGTVQLWDTAAAKCTRTFGEHEKRCWTVQFNSIDPHLMASGSDDGKVKLWSVMCPQSLCAIDAKVNVCCVYFSPKSRDQLVFGASDHCVHLYDLRQMSKPLNIFRGHRKAVSYVKYANENEVVSASTDSNLRLWDVNTGKCLQTMRGHQNEKNFVGLTTDGTHVICGSENNQLYIYYKAIGEPLLSFDFGKRCVAFPMVPSPSPSTMASSSALNPTDLLAANTDFSFTAGHRNFFDAGGAALSPWQIPSPSVELHHNAVVGNFTTTVSSSTAQQQHQQHIAATAGGGGDFVSAVCWKRNSNIVLAANSQGQTFVLRLE